MFETFKRSREIQQTLVAYEGAQKGSTLDQTAEGLRKDLAVLRGRMRKQVMWALTAVLLGAGGVYYERTRVENNKTPALKVVPASPYRDDKSHTEPGEGSSGLRDEALSRLHLDEKSSSEASRFGSDLQNRIYDLLGREQGQKVLESMTNNTDDLDTWVMTVFWDKKLEKVTSSIPDQYSGRSLYQFFNAGVVPQLDELTVENVSLLNPNRFFVRRVETIGKGEARRWFNEHRVPCYDKEFKFLALPQAMDESGQDPELTLFAIQDLAKDRGLSIKEGEGVSEDAEEKLKAFLSTPTFINGLREAELKGILAVLEGVDRRVLNSADGKKGLAPEEINRRIEKSIYYQVRLLESLRDKRLEKIRPLLRKVIENPQEYLPLKP